MKPIIIITLVIISSVLHSQVSQQWVNSFNGAANRNDAAVSVAIDGSGNIYVTGSSQGYNNYNNMVTIKYGPSGGQQWIAYYGTPFSGIANPVGMTIDNSGNVYVLAYNGEEGTTAYLIIKYNTSGDQQWEVHYYGPNYGTSLPVPEAIAVDGSGNVYATGWINDASQTERKYATVKYSANGVYIWAQIYSGFGAWNTSSAIAIDNSGNIFVTGSGLLFNHLIYLTVKYSPSGNFQWASAYEGPTNGDNSATSIAVDGSGNSYVTGQSMGTDSYFHCATVKYNSSGAQQWASRYNGPGNENDNAARVVFKNGHVYVGGTSAGVSSGKDYLAIKYTANGDELWNATYNGPGGDDIGKDITVDDYGIVYVTGKSAAGVHTRISTVRFNSNGTQQWVQYYSTQCTGNRDEGAYSIALGPNNGNGVVVVAGEVTHNDNQCNNDDFCIIKYSQTGIGITPISGNIPDKYSLEQNYPNPFNPSTKISFDILKTGFTELTIYDLLGNKIQTLVNESLNQGSYEINFDAGSLSSGVYFYKLTSGDFAKTQKMMLIK